MGYETYLVQMLQPLGVYDLSEGKINRAELAVYGTQMDLGADHLEDSGREMCLATAEGFGWLWHQRQGQGDGKPQLCTGVLSRRTWHSRQV